MNTITREQLVAALQQGGVTLVEALPERYWQASHLPGALNINHDEVDAKAPALLPERDADIVVYCANVNCQNSDIVAHRLGVLGYSQVRVYKGGKADWEAAGLPLQAAASAAA